MIPNRIPKTTITMAKKANIAVLGRGVSNNF
jgi:hypothetical protein